MLDINYLANYTTVRDQNMLNFPVTLSASLNHDGRIIAIWHLRVKKLSVQTCVFTKWEAYPTEICKLEHSPPFIAWGGGGGGGGFRK